MTYRGYYNDSYRIRFEARVIETGWSVHQPFIVLDQTYFYPESGGQPYDLGTIQGTPVSNVYVRESDQEIIHVVERPIPDLEIEGIINWTRRFDHMQQHTGQHALSQAFLQRTGAETVGFHLGRSASTLDLDITQLSWEEAADVEYLANQLIWENRNVHILYASPEDLASHNLRKVPDRAENEYRLINIENFDLSACGGTHVARTGEIGLIKVAKFESRGQGLRVEFLCGRRAFKDYRQQSLVIRQLMTDMTTSADELPNAVSKLHDELKLSRRQIKRQSKQLIQNEVAALQKKTEKVGAINLISTTFEERDPATLRKLANQLANGDGVVVLFGMAGKKSHLIFASAKGVNVSMETLLKSILPHLTGASGGGSGRFAQGGGPPASLDQVAELLEYAKLKLYDLDTAMKKESG